MSPRVPLTFGQGLDRETGVMAVRPGSMEDLRNVLIHLGKLQVRPGHSARFQLVDNSSNPMTHVLAAHAMKSTRNVILVAYNDVNGEVHVFRADDQLNGAAWVAEWTSTQADGLTDIFPQDAGDDPPIIHVAEVNRRVFFAHDKNSVTFRAQTAYYHSPPTGSESFNLLTEDFREAATAEPVRFRGVVRHKAYLVGWGFGTEDVAGPPAGEDRPELLRISTPGIPDLGSGDSFDSVAYFVVGDRDDPILRCIGAGDTLLICKETEVHVLYGSGVADFGVFELDLLHGIAASRLAVNVAGAAFIWTAEGPRVYDGSNAGIALDVPLELYGVEPTDLVEEGSLVNAFAEYLPAQKRVHFYFGRRVYVLTIRSQPWQWSWDELPFTPNCAWRVPPFGAGLGSPPTGYPSGPVASAITDTTATITVTNNSQDGDEFTEIWAKPNGGTWELVESRPTGNGATDVYTLVGNFSPGLDQTMRVRYKRGGAYTEGYESGNPEDWPASSEGTFTTTLTNTPEISGLAWSRTSASEEQMAVTLALDFEDVQIYPDVEIERDMVLVETELAPANDFTYNDTGVTGETSECWRARYTTADDTGGYGSTVCEWSGPPQHTSMETPVGGDEEYTLTWVNADESAETEVWDNWTRPAGPTGSFPLELAATKSAGVLTHNEQLAGADGETLSVGIRHKATAFGVDDYGPFTQTTVDIAGP